MTLKTKSSFKNTIISLYEDYVERFNSEWNEEGSYEPCVICGDEEKGTGEYIDTIPEDQTEFIFLYIHHMMIGSDTKDNLKIIEHFLSMQGAMNTENRMQIQFLLGDSVPEVYVYVDNFSEVDLADTYGLTEFKMMHIYNANMKKWTLKTIRELIRDVKDDFRFDGYEPKLDYRYAGPLLEIKCRM